MIHGAMQDWPLLVWKLIDHAALNHGRREIVSWTCEGVLHRSNWAEVRRRARQVASALRRFGIQPGDRVGTLAWNTHRHVECWYGISGMGGVAHTINPRLFEDQIVYIANHAEDRLLFLDLTFVGLVEKLAPRFQTIERYVLLTDRAHMPASSSIDFLCYEDWVAEGDPDEPWTELPETAPAGLCYTSGTTGNPKGVEYTHRSNVLHAMAACMTDVFAAGARSVILPIAPMYHANAWSIPYTAAACGAKLVLNGPAFDAPTLRKLIVEEGVDLALAVPTVWLTMRQHLEKTGGDLGRLRRTGVGGSAVPQALIEFYDRLGVRVVQLWGMTELSPLGTVGTPLPEVADLPYEEEMKYRIKQGRPIFGVEMCLKDEEGRMLPRDGKTFGRLMVRGPWVVARYFKGEGGQILDEDGWFDTGDIATIDELGYMQIVDRAKDVIKSGGEWISSIDLENIAVGCPGIAEAAVIGLPHPKWDERPLLILVRKEGAQVTEADVRAYLADKIAKWWMPDAIEFVDEIPHTATGKIRKTALREMFRNYRLAAA
ncbi:MAG: long-chain fatty acid--CoA ligase [Sphingomonadaceae bacterium]|uniref:long-chain fatty acid--CoA ligase n=1 Tax=Thermaurantiacus sp. TaxID=2820283 RepID=UPI00298F3A49|nr:long-chain fatty acid--CoA ligase [Thermaurantiacus sp.]MCS6985952.1 long-chain fatty acid--CoA ligase [Sphingomonadaceae bacterium]MDW8414832.1 long-chain fatty acid--CoA ligase [Thermaurantiacus sp.]